MKSHDTTALLLIEIQNEFLSEGGIFYPMLRDVLEKNHVIDNLKRLIEVAQDKGMLIVHTPIQFSPDYREMGQSPYGIMKIVKDAGALIRGTWGTEIASFVSQDKDKIIVEGKSTIDAFSGTSLDKILRSHGVSRVALAGLLTNVCVESTMRSAYELGYKVFGITDACASISLRHHEDSVAHNWPMFSNPVTHAEFISQM